jgi:hypothetical protein
MRANGCTRYIQNFPVLVGFMRLSANLRKWPNMPFGFSSEACPGVRHDSTGSAQENASE